MVPLFSLQRKLTERIDLMYFADICAGPGGFTEYFLYRTKWHAKGFGFTLRSKDYTSILYGYTTFLYLLINEV